MTSTTSTRTAARRPTRSACSRTTRAVIWYTGDDLYVREPTQPGGTGNSKLVDDEVIAVRDYLNDRGSVLVTGQQALQGAWLTSSSTTRSARRRTRAASPTRLAGPGQRGRPGRAEDELRDRLQRLHPVLPGRLDQRHRRAPTTTSRRCRSRAPAGRSARRRSRSTAATRRDNQVHGADVRDDRRASCRRASSRSSPRRARSGSTGRRRSTRRRAPSTPTRSPATRASSGCAARST